ncbi:hypothetical protein [Rhodopirellula sp. MGV]|uniref:hypothetical protein n=1 Tax=Rhodopirellula sp. MGV TaxID=2023130 RepID=UPI000B9664F9|nr:hypothetical protein [Rhodopirellula sp. MGV]OYP29368.1 hypothetical protein CGZ80_24470 [Rhodopirellula sp. MGV]PNY35674.1 hypothetical protein C2E31_16425 [Rhodopirellula baltica]
MYRLPLFAGLVITLVSIGSSQEAVEPAADRAPTASHRHLAIMVGLPGDDTHREQMTAAAEKLIRNVEQTLSVKPEHLTVLAGDAEMQETLSAAHESVGISNAKTVEQTLREASEKLTPSDAYWVIMIGHSHLNGIECQFNVTDRDFNQVDFAKWSEPVKCSEQVFWLTQPLSGLWIKPMAKPGRVVLTSTEADLEFTGTEMPYALADLLAGESSIARWAILMGTPKSACSTCI